MRLFVEMFRQWAALTPETVAAIDDSRRYTYGELDGISNRFAASFLDAGIGHGDIVAIVRKRDALFLAAIIGLFKIGAAYVPIDTDVPLERRNLILRKCACRLLLYDNPPEGASPPAVAHASVEAWAALGPLDRQYPLINGPADLAYVIFTSGSTGEPKGAMVAHAGMMNHLLAKAEELSLTAADCIAQTASQSFDISVWQFLVALIVGGRVVIIERHVVTDSPSLLDVIEREGASVLEVVPSHLLVLIEELLIDPQDVRLSRLRWLLATGETLPVSLAGQWLAIRPNVPLVNAYGPTECSDDVTHHFIFAPPQGQSLPIGHAIRNVSLFVVDEELRLVSQGTIGELLVGGIAVGLGYIGEPEKTAKAFIPDHLTGQTAARLYRTGDLVRQLASGDLEYHGRADHQVKVHGHRIELGEIEACLLSVRNIRGAVVVSMGEPPSTLLHAFVELASNTGVAPEVAIAEARNRLAEELPPYMIPSTIRCIDSFPLSPNGKIDRIKLKRNFSNDG